MSRILKNRNMYKLQEDLTQADLARLQESKIVAVDTELTGLNPNRDLLCLIQVCDQNGVLTFLKSHDWHNAPRLRDFLLDSRVTKVFHFAVTDCSFLLTQVGVLTEGAYCTKIASKLARTYSSEHSLKSLTKEFLSIELDKSQTSTDWLRSDLSAKQLKYAANDVLWLIKLKFELESLLERKGELPTGISYGDLNRQCQALIPTLVNLSVNGWDFGKEDRTSVFGY